MLSVFQYWLYYLLLWREISRILILLYQHMMWHYQSYHKFFRYSCQAIYIVPLFHIQITLSVWNPDLRNGRLLWRMLIFVNHKSFNQIQQLYHPNFPFFKWSRIFPLIILYCCPHTNKEMIQPTLHSVLIFCGWSIRNGVLFCCCCTKLILNNFWIQQI